MYAQKRQIKVSKHDYGEIMSMIYFRSMMREIVV